MLLYNNHNTVNEVVLVAIFLSVDHTNVPGHMYIREREIRKQGNKGFRERGD